MSLADTVRDAVVVGVDGSEHSARAVAWGAEQAALEGRRLALVHGDRLVTASDPVHDVVRRRLAQATAHRPGLEVEAVLAEASSRDALVEASRTARLLVLGSRGRGAVRSALLGSVSAEVAQHAECPVVVSRPHRPGRWTSGVLVGADGTEGSLPVVEFAFRLASQRELPLTVMHTTFDLDVEDEDKQAALRLLLSESVAGFSEEHPDVHVDRRIGRGLTDEQLRRGLHPWSVIVVGRHPRRAPWQGLGASTAASVLEHYEGVVAVVPEAAAGPGLPGAP